MAENHVRLVYELPQSKDEAGAPPSEFRIFAFGLIATTKGDFLFDLKAAQECMNAFNEYGNRLTIDYEHQALSDPPIIAPAAASFVPVMRADGIWATDVKWTPRAAEMLRNKEYLYFSPAFCTDAETRPVRILNIALTNIPATKRMQPLVAAKHTETTMKTVLTALSLSDSASEAEALSAVTKLNDQHRRLLTAIGKDSVDEALGAVAAYKAQAERATELAAQVEAIKAEKEASETATLLNDATVDGRITPANRPYAEKFRAEFGDKAFRAYLGGLPKSSAPAVAPGKDWKPEGVAAPGVVGLTDAQLKIIKATGLTPEQFASHAPKYRQLVNPSEEK